MSDVTTVWVVYEPGTRDDQPELYGIFTTEDKANRAAELAGDCLSVAAVQLDALYLGERSFGCYRPGALDYPQPDPDHHWDRVVVDAGPSRLEIET